MQLFPPPQFARKKTPFSSIKNQVYDKVESEMKVWAEIQSLRVSAYVFLARAQLLIKTLMSDGLLASSSNILCARARARKCVIDKRAISLILSLEVLVCIHHRCSAWVNIHTLQHTHTHTQANSLILASFDLQQHVSGWKSGAKISPISLPRSRI
jgi:hypothetical protein